jgi:hypothetical protein
MNRITIVKSLMLVSQLGYSSKNDVRGGSRDSPGKTANASLPRFGDCLRRALSKSMRPTNSAAAAINDAGYLSVERSPTAGVG